MDKKEYEKEMYSLMSRLYPICRSITGNGVRESLQILSEIIPIEQHEVKSGTEVFDWIIPNEWRVDKAYLKYQGDDNYIVNFNNSNLHLLNYSRPYKGIVDFDELSKHCYYLEEYPDWIPYRTAYYSDEWGFCIPYNEYIKLDRTKKYEVLIDTELFPGSLTYGEYFIKGKSNKEVLISTYLCHPSLCNDNLSGVVMCTYLAKILSEKKNELNYSYRFIFVPETIGAITWLAQNESKLSDIVSGLVATCVGDAYPFTYKKTRDGNKTIDYVTEKALIDLGKKFRIIDYYPGGSDERQYGSPGINLPVGSLVRGLYTTDTIPPRPFKEYHTSADNLNYVKGKYLQESLDVYLKILDYFEKNDIYISDNMKCEPFLAKRKLNLKIGSGKGVYMTDVAIRFVMCYSDGKNDLIEISKKARISFEEIYSTAKVLESVGLIHKKS